MTETTLLLACGVFREEFSRLPEDLRAAFEPRFFDSMLHMRPDALDRLLAETLPPPPRRAVILYGDCSPHMREYGARIGTARVEGVNCIEISLGSERYRKLRASGAFFFMPEWTKRWERVFKEELGLGDRQLARDFMGENATGLVFVDTGGTAAEPSETLEAAAEYVGLPVRIERTGTGPLERALRAALGRLRDA